LPSNLPFRTINTWFIAITVTIAAFMELLDTSIANVALPYIGGGLGRSYDEVTWILTAYLVANAVVLPMTAFEYSARVSSMGADGVSEGIFSPIKVFAIVSGN
jgi:MFS family permease